MADDEQDLDVALARSADIITERDFVLLLISLYRDFPVLWKVKSKEYADKNKRSMALTNIVKSLRIYKPTYTEELLKKKINALRTNFNKEKNRIERAIRSGASPDDVPKPSLYYYNELLFLSDQMCISNTESSLSSEISGSPNHQKEMPPLPKQKKSKKTAQEDLMEIATQYFKRPDSESDVIAKSWAVKLKRLAPDQRRYAEKIINDVLFEGEMGTLSRNGVCILSASSPSYSSPSENYAAMTYPYQSPSPHRPPTTPSPNSFHSTVTYESPAPHQSPSPNAHHSTITYQSPAPQQSPSPNAHHSTITYQSPAPHQSPSPNAHHSTITYQSPAPHQSPSPNAHHSTITYRSPAPHQSPSPNAHHSTVTYQSPAPHQSPSPNAHHSTVTYQSPAPHQSPSPNAHHSTVTYQSPAPHQSPSPNAHHSTVTYQSPSPNHSPSPNRHHSFTPYQSSAPIILSSQNMQAPNQSYEQPVVIQEPTTEEEESQTAAKFLENFYSF